MKLNLDLLSDEVPPVLTNRIKKFIIKHYLWGSRPFISVQDFNDTFNQIPLITGGKKDGN